jgi:biopolymer transport protein TolR
VAKAGQQKGEPVRVVVRADGRVSVIDAAKREQNVAAGELVSAIRQRQGGNPQTPVVIEGDKQARYESVMKVMSELQKAGVERVGLLVELNQR